MKTIEQEPSTEAVLKPQEDYFSLFKNRIYSVLESYSNVHRGSGQKSLITTRLYEHARKVTGAIMHINPRKQVVVFASPYSAAFIRQHFKEAIANEINSEKTGLALGVYAFAMNNNTLKEATPPLAGGGTARLTHSEWVLWEKMPDIFETGTPAIINVIAFVVAWQMQQRYGKDIFRKNNNAPHVGLDIEDYPGLEGEELLDKLIDDMPGRYFSVPGKKGTQTYINLDNSASTPTLLPVWETWCSALQASEVQKQRITAQTKEICAGFLNAPAEEYELFFTANTTESINLAAQIINKQAAESAPGIILSSLLEHSSNDLPWRLQPNLKMLRISCNEEGFIDTAELESTLKKYNVPDGNEKIQWVSITGASNVYGTVNNIPEICLLAHSHDAKVFIDAAQLVAHRPVDVIGWGVDAMAFSGHKIYAPFGTGVLIMRKSVLNGQMTLAPSCENTSGIAALGKSLQLLKRAGMNLIQNREQELTQYALMHLAGMPKVKLYGVAKPQHPAMDQKLGVIIFQAGQKMPFSAGRALAAQAIGIRVGCHCAHITVKRVLGITPLQEKLQRIILILFPKLKLQGVARLSLGIENTKEDIQRVVKTLKNFVEPGKNDAMDTLSSKARRKRDEIMVEHAIRKVFL